MLYNDEYQARIALAKAFEDGNIGSIKGPGLSRAQIDLLADEKNKELLLRALRSLPSGEPCGGSSF